MDMILQALHNAILYTLDTEEIVIADIIKAYDAKTPQEMVNAIVNHNFNANHIVEWCVDRYGSDVDAWSITPFGYTLDEARELLDRIKNDY